ncbi:dTMP kinase [bacterium]|nr:dTMP kinase [bacterium]
MKQKLLIGFLVIFVGICIQFQKNSAGAMEQKTSKGCLIVFEGVDGSGKSSLIRQVSFKLSIKNFDIVNTQEPGSTSLGRTFGKILEDHDGEIGITAEFMLFAANRAEHIEKIVLPSMAEGKVVLSDRMGDSSVVYQGHAGGLDVDFIKTVNAFAMKNIEPDLIIFLSLPEKTALERLRNSGRQLDRFETRKADYKETVRKGYEKELRGRKNVLEVDASLSTQEMAEKIIPKILETISKKDVHVRKTSNPPK